MSVHYKFRSVSKKWGTVNFDSAVISLNDLKRAIVLQEKTDPNNRDFDFIITNAQTHERYTADNFLIPKNTSVEVKRVPVTHATNVRILQTPEVVNTTTKTVDPFAFSIDTADEHRQPLDVISQTAMPSAAQPRQLANVTCRGCKRSDHLEKDCEFVVPTIECSTPPRLTCKLCRNLFTDPCVTPCCYTTYCSSCLRQALLASSQLACPFCCHAGIEIEALKPNIGIKKALNEYLQGKTQEQTVRPGSPIGVPVKPLSPETMKPLFSPTRSVIAVSPVKTMTPILPPHQTFVEMSPSRLSEEVPVKTVAKFDSTNSVPVDNNQFVSGRIGNRTASVKSRGDPHLHRVHADRPSTRWSGSQLEWARSRVVERRREAQRRHPSSRSRSPVNRKYGPVAVSRRHSRDEVRR